MKALSHFYGSWETIFSSPSAQVGWNTNTGDLLPHHTTVTYRGRDPLWRERKGTLHWDTFLVKLSTLQQFTPRPQRWKEFVHSLNTGDKEKFCPMEVLGGLRPTSDATLGDQPAHSRKGRHSGHCLVEYPLHTDGKEAVAATLAGSASIGPAWPAVARSAVISTETAWEPKPPKAPV